MTSGGDRVAAALVAPANVAIVAPSVTPPEVLRKEAYATAGAVAMREVRTCGQEYSTIEVYLAPLPN